MRELLDDIDRWQQDGHRVAIARVVDVEGSGPRLPGAAMAVTEYGEVAGSVSGGCVEGAVVGEALAVLAGEREPGVVTFGYSDDEAFAVGPHLRRHDPPVHRSARLVTSSSNGSRRRCGPSSRSPWPPSSTGRTSGPRSSSRRAASPIGTLGDPELDRVVDARCPGRAGGGGARGSGTTGRKARPRPRTSSISRPCGCSSSRTRRPRRCGSSVRSTSPPRWPGWPRCSATGSRCATPARCSPPAAASRWPTRCS